MYATQIVHCYFKRIGEKKKRARGKEKVRVDQEIGGTGIPY